MKPSVAGLALLVVAPALLAPPALAQVSAPPGGPAPGRYQFQPVEGGLARLDTATGEITICRLDPARMACDMGPPAASPSPAPAAGVPPRPSAEAAEEEEFERALGRMKRVFRAFGDMAREFETETPPTKAPDPDRT